MIFCNYFLLQKIWGNTWTCNDSWGMYVVRSELEQSKPIQVIRADIQDCTKSLKPNNIHLRVLKELKYEIADFGSVLENWMVAKVMSSLKKRTLGRARKL